MSWPSPACTWGSTMSVGWGFLPPPRHPAANSCGGKALTWEDFLFKRRLFTLFPTLFILTLPFPTSQTSQHLMHLVFKKVSQVTQSYTPKVTAKPTSTQIHRKVSCSTSPLSPGLESAIDRPAGRPNLCTWDSTRVILPHCSLHSAIPGF